MKVAQRSFTTISALRGMMMGFKMLYGVQPAVRIITKSTLGDPKGVICDDGTILFTNHHGVELIDIGNKYITVLDTLLQPARIDVAGADVQFEAAFHVE